MGRRRNMEASAEGNFKIEGLAGMEGHTYGSLGSISASDRENVFFPRPQTRHMNKKYPSKLPTQASGRAEAKPLGPINPGEYVEA